MRSLTPLLLILLVLTVCCGRPDSRRAAEIVEMWQGREILFPAVMTDVLTGDTIDPYGADFTILAYVDSVGCTGCRMKLPLWKEYLGSLDSVAELDVRFVMVSSPADVKELRYLLKSNGFDFPVFSDSGNKMYEANRFPREAAFGAFLLDRNRKVVAVGSPVFSSEIGRLYKSIISGRMSFSPETGNAVAESFRLTRKSKQLLSSAAIQSPGSSNAQFTSTTMISNILQ